MAANVPYDTTRNLRALDLCAQHAETEGDRAALWRLQCSWRPRRGAAEDDLLRDYGHWRLYLASREGDEVAGEAFRRYWTGYVRVFCGAAAADEAASTTCRARH